jgi:hypothetical protein
VVATGCAARSTGLNPHHQVTPTVTEPHVRRHRTVWGVPACSAASTFGTKTSGPAGSRGIVPRPKCRMRPVRRPGRTCAGTPSPTQNRRYAIAFGVPWTPRGPHSGWPLSGRADGVDSACAARAPCALRPRVQIRYRSAPTHPVTRQHSVALSSSSGCRRPLSPW